MKLPAPLRRRWRNAKLRYAKWQLRHVTLPRLAEEGALRFGEAPFCLFEEETWSFVAFNGEANRWAHLFQARGVKQGEVVALMMENRPEFLAALTGLCKLGVVTAAINTHQRGPALAYSLNLCRAERVVVGAECLEALAEVLPSVERIAPAGVFVHTRWKDGSGGSQGGNPAVGRLPGSHDLNPLLAEAETENPPRAPLNARSLLMYIFTSGTTGLPKAAHISHGRLVGIAQGQQSLLALGPGERLYCPLPLYHSNGGIAAFGGPLISGAALVLARGFHASRFWEECHRHGATRFIYIGELLRYLVNTPPGPFDRSHNVRRILGNGLRADIWKAFQQRFGIPVILEFYASTEGNVYLLNLDGTPGSVGRPVPTREENLVLVRWDEQQGGHLRNQAGFLVPCAPGEVGELLGAITSLSTFEGYTEPGEGEKKTLRHVFRRGDAYFRTGDLLRRDEAGNFFFIDRIGDTFRWKGENVSTEEVQKILLAFEGVSMTNVFGVAVPGAEGRAGMAALTLEMGTPLDGVAFYRFVAHQLASYARPAFLRIVGEMEVTTTFKLRKPDLQKEGFDPAVVREPLYYRDDLAQAYLPLDDAALEKIRSGAIRF